MRAAASYEAVAPSEAGPADRLDFFRRHVPSFDYCLDRAKALRRLPQ